jgi:hypothetical protein
MVSTSPLPNMPSPVSYFQTWVLTPLPADPAKLADQTLCHEVDAPAASVGVQAVHVIANNKHIIMLAGHIRHKALARTLLPPVGFRESA